MSSRARKILDDAFNLSADERALVAIELARSVEMDADGVREQWSREAIRRLRELEDGTVAAVPHDQVRDEVRKLLTRP